MNIIMHQLDLRTGMQYIYIYLHTNWHIYIYFTVFAYICIYLLYINTIYFQTSQRLPSLPLTLLNINLLKMHPLHSGVTEEIIQNLNQTYSKTIFITICRHIINSHKHYKRFYNFKNQKKKKNRAALKR